MAKICVVFFFRFSLFDSYLDKGSDLNFSQILFFFPPPRRVGIMLVLLRGKTGFSGPKAAAPGRLGAGGAHGFICLSVRSLFIYFFLSPQPCTSSSSSCPSTSP